MTTTTPESRARIAYAAYGRRVKFRSASDTELPPFDDLDPERREAWVAAAFTIWELATTGRTVIR